MREIVAIFLEGTTNKSDVIQDLTTFSFLYGTIPSAPGVFVYATAYALDIDLVCNLNFVMIVPVNFVPVFYLE